MEIPSEGVLRVTLTHATTRTICSIGTPKMLVMFILEGKEVRSTTQSGWNPYWGEVLEIASRRQGTLYFRLMSKSLFNFKLLGEGEFSLSKLPSSLNKDSSFSVYKSSKKTGEIHMILNFLSNTKTPSPQTTLKKPHKRMLSYDLTLGNLEFQKELTTEKNTKLYEGRVADTKVLVRVKECLRVEEFNKVQREALTLSRVSYPSICKVLGSLLDTSDSKLKHILVQEKLEGKNLLEVINFRAKRNNFWTEDKLWKYFESLVRSFAHLERNQIAHSDIKPSHFVCSSGIKLFDFGAYVMVCSEEATFGLTGTLTYFSPLEFQAYTSYLKGENPERLVTHNPFKSDTYSLGLTFYQMSSLKLPLGLNECTDKLRTKLQSAIKKLNYSSKLKELLLNMLEVDQTKRPSFTDLESYFGV